MILVAREAASHWYLPSGEALHEVPRADGNGMRPTTLRDARKVNAFPSVTNILNVLAKPALDAWKQEQAIMAALTLPKGENEDLDAFAHRVVADMKEQTSKAADLGTSVHNAIEVYLQTGDVPEEATIRTLFTPAKIWLDANVERIGSVEITAVHPVACYAGKADLVAKIGGRWTIVDFKTQNLKVDTRKKTAGEWKANFYETWPLQLCAYKSALNYTGEHSRRIEAVANVVINSHTPSEVQVKFWPDEEHDSYVRAFAHCTHLWSYLKNYTPTPAI